MKVLVSDSLAEEGINKLKDKLTVDVITGLSEDELVDKIKDYDALVVRSGTKVTEKVINAADNLKIVGRAGVGIDNIDVDAATNKGIIVVNTPEGNMISAAEHTISMMMAMCRNIPQAHASLKSKKWERKKFMGVEVNGKYLGVIGLGRIGSYVAQRGQALHMKVLGYDPYVSQEQADEMGVELTSVEDIAKRADFITVHTPLTKATKNIINAEKFALMKDGVRILNCARGGIIDEDALLDALRSGKVAGAALDVFVNEPPFDSPLLDFDNVITTPHLGASTEEAQVNVAEAVADEVISALTGGPVNNAINIPTVKPELMPALTPYLKLAETMGKFAGQLMSGNYKRVEVEYSGDILDKDIKPVTVAALKGILENALGPGVNFVNATSLAKSRKIKVIEGKSETTNKFPSTITLELTRGSETKSITGTVSGNGRIGRIIQIDNYHVDIVPTEYMLVIDHLNRPNVIGPCAILLGKNDINISGMQVGQVGLGEKTIMVLNVDSEVPKSLLDEIKSIEGILDAKPVTL